MAFYIKSASCISPQHTFLKRANWYEDIVSIGEDAKMFITEIPYKEYIPANKLRRMKRNVRMGLTCAKDALHLAEIEKPDAIIVGSSLGIVQDTENFLNQIIDQNETMLNPTAFIQSTHNTVAGSIALSIGCKKHNLTFSQLNASFEHALLDGMLLLEDDNTVRDILIGAQDELTNENFDIYSSLNRWKKNTDYTSLYESNTNGSIAGEGAAYFVVTQEKTPVEIVDSEMVFHTQTAVNTVIDEFLQRNRMSVHDVDAVMLGYSGDSNSDNLYQQLVDGLFSNNNILCYKHLCGDQPSASAFAWWLSNEILTTNNVPETLIYKKRGEIKGVKNILIYHCEENSNHCISLVQKAD